MYILTKITLALALFTCFFTPAFATNSLTSQLDTLSANLELAKPEQFETIKQTIDADPDQALASIKQKIASSEQMPEQTLALYLWAMGMTRSTAASGDIIRLSNSYASGPVQQSAIQALSIIGDDTAGEHLLARAKMTDDPMQRFTLFDAMARMHYRPAIPASTPILAQDLKQTYWQVIFVYGKYGDDAVPFLLEQLNSKDKRVRSSATMALGQWLICPESVPMLKKMYAGEKDPELRLGILSALESSNPDYADMLTFTKEVLQKDQDQNIHKYAQETVDNNEQLQRDLAEYKSSKKNNRAAFEMEYAALTNSYGKNGDYKILSECSTVADEKKLKELKEVILQRNSDECFYDYQKINQIIRSNRMI